MRTPLGAGTSQRTVLFLDFEGWSVFDQVACATRRDGIRAVKIAASTPTRAALHDFRWWADRYFYDERVAVDNSRDVGRIKELILTGQVADVIVAEPSLAALGFNCELGQLMTAHSLAFKVTPATDLLDKFEVNRRLATVGINIPRQVCVDELTPGDIAQEFGFPVILKARVGAAGANVRIANSETEIERAIESLGGYSKDVFYQEYIDGNRVFYGAVVGQNGPILEHGFYTCAMQYPLGPSAFVRFHDHADLLEAGRAAIQLFGCRGFVSFGFNRAPDGRIFHLDANIRPWGSLLAPLREGVDFAAAYASLLDDRPWPASVAISRCAKEFVVLPGMLMNAKTVPAFVQALATLWRVHAWRLTLGYAILISSRAVLTRLQGLTRRIGHLLSRGTGSNPTSETRNGTTFVPPKRKSAA